MQANTVPKLAFSVEDAAEVAGVSRATLYAEIKSKRIETFKIGSRRLISLSAIEKYIRAREAETGNTTEAA